MDIYKTFGKYIVDIWMGPKYAFYPLNANPTNWSNTLKQFVGNSRKIFWVCLTILWGWRLKS